MNITIKLTALALASIAISGCEQRPSTDNEMGTEQPENSTGMTDGDTGQTTGTMGTGTGQEIDDLDPTMDANSQDQNGQMMDDPATNNDLPE